MQTKFGGGGSGRTKTAANKRTLGVTQFHYLPSGK